MADPSFGTFLSEAGARVDAALDEWLPTEAHAGDLAAAMRHIALPGGKRAGKRLRPALVFLGCRDVGGDEADAVGAAAAMELVHAYSLVHDDLPCMVDATMRRGRECVHRIYGEAMGVLAGDALLTLAFEVIARGSPAGAPIGAMVEGLARASGWDGMVGGQVQDLEAEGSEPDIERVRRIHLGKTAALISASLRLGALAGGGDPADVERLAGVGISLGLAFQIVDDVLDTEVDAEQMGKDTGADADNDKLTWPAVVGVAQAKEDGRQLVAEASEAAQGGQATDLLLALGQRILDRRN